jgi:hypothetical protein
MLEDRLPPGDAVFGGLLAHTLLAGSAAGVAIVNSPSGFSQKLTTTASAGLPALGLKTPTPVFGTSLSTVSIAQSTPTRGGADPIADPLSGLADDFPSLPRSAPHASGGLFTPHHNLPDDSGATGAPSAHGGADSAPTPLHRATKDSSIDPMLAQNGQQASLSAAHITTNPFGPATVRYATNPPFATNKPATPPPPELMFEQNVGQADASHQFVARGPGYTAFIGGADTALFLPGASASDPKVTGEYLNLHLVASNISATVTGGELLPARTNYMIGNDPSAWHTNVPNFATAIAHSVYAGIDMVYHAGPNHELEYDFVVSPAADPNVIHMQVQGAKGVHLDSQGNLIVSTEIGDLTEHVVLPKMMA